MLNVIAYICIGIVTFIFLAIAATISGSWLKIPKFSKRAKLRPFEQELADAFLQRGKLDGISVVVVKENSYYYRWTDFNSGSTKASLHIVYKLGNTGPIADSLDAPCNTGKLEISIEFRDYLTGVYYNLKKSEDIQTEYKIMCSLRGLSADYVPIRYMYRGSSEWIDMLARKNTVSDVEYWFSEDDILINWHPSITVDVRSS